MGITTTTTTQTKCSKLAGGGLLAVLACLLLSCGSPAPPTTGSTRGELYAGLTPEDRLLAGKTRQFALEKKLSQEALGWQSPEGTPSGSVTPLSTYRTKAGYFCRTYREIILIGSGRRTAQSTACRDKTGTWKAIEAIKP